jgi:hypothetical protein
MRGWITAEFLSSWVRESPLFGFSLVRHCFLSGHRASEHSRLGAALTQFGVPSVLAEFGPGFTRYQWQFAHG